MGAIREAEARVPDHLAVNFAVEASGTLAKRQAGIAAEIVQVAQMWDRRG